MAITVSVLGNFIKLPFVLLHFLTIFYNVVNMKTKLLCLAVRNNYLKKMKSTKVQNPRRKHASVYNTREQSRGSDEPSTCATQ